MRGVVTIFSLLVLLAAAGGASAESGTPELLTPGVLAGGSARVALFHPGDARSLQMLDQLAQRSSGDLLAICVGAGCNAESAAETARQRSWPFHLAFDPTGEVCLDALRTRAAGSLLDRDAAPAPATAGERPPGMAAGAGLAHALSGPLSRRPRSDQGVAVSPATPHRPAMSHALTSDRSARTPSVHNTLFIAVPLALFGIGGAALVVGSRWRRQRDDGEENEAERVERFLRDRHGRKPPPS